VRKEKWWLHTSEANMGNKFENVSDFEICLATVRYFTAGTIFLEFQNQSKDKR
jgi:hypothetical protein